MSLQNFYFWNLKDCCCFCFLGLWGKGDLSRAEKLLYFVGCAVEEKWHTSSLRLVFTSLVELKKKKKEKNGEMFHVSCLFLPKAKRRAKESWDRYSDIPREDVAGMKACHFVTDDHETAPLFFFSIFFLFFESDFVRIWGIYCFCFAVPLKTGMELWNWVFTSQSDVSFW